MGSLLAIGFVVIEPTSIPMEASAETIISQLGIDIDGEAAFDSSGVSVSLSSDGTRVAIGAYANGGSSGHVRVYELINGSWTQLGDDIDGEAASDYSGQSVSLSSDGTRVAIGAIYNDAGVEFSNRGHVRVYAFSSGSWTQLGSDIDGVANNDYFGHSVSLSSDGTRVAIGAINNDGGGSNAGHARVYAFSSGSWTQLGDDIDGEAAGDNSGHSVSLSSDGTRVAIGATGNDAEVPFSTRGHVRIYGFDGVDEDADGIDKWTQVGSDIDGEAAGDNSGYSVSLNSDGTRVAIAAPYNDGNGSRYGHVRVFTFSSGSWTQLGSDIDGEADNDYFGYSVSLSSDGTRVAIGAPFNDDNGSNSGHVRIYDWSGSAWGQVGSDFDGEATGDNSGRSVSLSSDGTRVAIGASGNDENGSNSGHVRLYSIVYQAPVPAAPAPIPAYSGPTLDSKQSVVAGEQVSFTGRRLHYVSSAYAGTTKLKIVSGVSELLVLDVPASLAAGSYDLVLYSSHGKLTFNQGLTISAPAPEVTQPEVIEPEAVKKLKVGTFKGFIAIYSQGYEGAKLSAKVAGKWLVVDALDESFKGSDYSRTVRFTGAGYDILVHLYINGELIKTEELTTK